jgi:Bacteriophage HK97-gp10, putative tail-component
MGASMEIDVEQVKANLSKFCKMAPKAAAAALYQIGLRIEADAKRRTPVDTGRLRNTAFTSPPTVVNGEVMVIVGFGTNYAIYVHENLAAHHTVGEAKFLERAFDEAKSSFVSDLAELLKRNIEDGVEVVPLEGPESPEDAGGSDRRSGRGRRGRRR